MISCAAGAIWPMLVVGLVELGSIIVYTKFQPEARIQHRHLGLVAEDA